MNDQQQRDSVVSMQSDMRHLLRTVDEIKAQMATKGELALLATKSEMATLMNRVDTLEREVRERSPGALWKTLTGFAAGLVAIGAALAWLAGIFRGHP